MIVSKLPRVGTTIFSRMTSLAGTHNALNLAQGFPDFDAPRALTDALAHHTRAGHNQYAPMAGEPALREQVAQQLANYRRVEADPEQEITILPGATEGIFCAVMACVRSGDEVIVLDPAYDSYEPAIELAGGRAVHVPLDSQDHSLDIERLSAAVTTRTRLLIINTPHNPCGSLLRHADMLALEALVQRHGLLVVSDEVYEFLVFDGEQHCSVLQYEGLRERSFALFSFGKTFAVTGWKTGYCVAPPALTEELRKVHQFVAFVAVTPVQRALADFMREHPDYPGNLAHFYQRKRDLFCSALRDSRFRLRPSAGSFFQLLDYRDISREPDHELCEDWTRQFGVASIPVSIFYQQPPPGQTVLRFCFAKSDDMLLRAAEILCTI